MKIFFFISLIALSFFSVALALESNTSTLQVWTTPGTQISVTPSYPVIRQDQDSSFLFRFPPWVSNVWLKGEGPFGGKFSKALTLKPSQTLEIHVEEKKWTEDENNPPVYPEPSLPILCPRLNAEKVYEGPKDFFSYRNFENQKMLWLKKAKLSFDYEDRSVLVGFDLNGNAHFETGGGFYANIHYVIFPYDEKLMQVYRNLEDDWIKLRKMEKKLSALKIRTSERSPLEKQMRELLDRLRGKGLQVGPHALLMNLFFQTPYLLPDPKLLKDLPSPIVHGFLPGPFYGSTNLGYQLCEWGDTALHAPVQEMNYRDYALAKWNTQKPDEKLILMLVEGDEQMKKIGSRLNWERLGVLRSWDYADDLVGFFILSKKESSGKTIHLKTPGSELELSLESR